MIITPIIEEISFLEPSIFFELFKEENYAFFLDSNNFGKYSFIGFDPFIVFKSKKNKIEVYEGQEKKSFKGVPFEILKKISEKYKITTSEKIPFLGGGVGYLGYDLCHFIEKLPMTSKDDLNLQDSIFCFYDLIFIFDIFARKSYIVSTGFPETNFSRETKAKIRLKEVKKKITKNILVSKNTKNTNKTEFVSNFKKEDYLKAINKIKKYISAGDVYQINLSQRFSAKLHISSYELYKKLRNINPAPFASFLNFGDLIIVSSSPERFLYKRGNIIETCPIKGTRPRLIGKDKQLKNELKQSEKDKAELIMIVDLLRNDLGRVCDYGSIKVVNLRKIETHPTVFHTVAIIRGELREEKNRIDLIKACFPGGSITGAPKIRAMEIIDELEPTTRGIYTGSIGYLSFTGDMDLNIVIRTFIIKNNSVYFSVGGGIVIDSDAEEEYNETLHKGYALMQSLR